MQSARTIFEGRNAQNLEDQLMESRSETNDESARAERINTRPQRNKKRQREQISEIVSENEDISMADSSSKLHRDRLQKRNKNEFLGFDEGKNSDAS
jgi:hypothetical protein